MRPGSILICGVGGVGAAWAAAMGAVSPDIVDILVIDGDPGSEPPAPAQWIPLNPSLAGVGTAGVPDLGRMRMEEHVPLLDDLLLDVDLLILVGALGGGSATGAMSVIAQRANRSGTLTIGLVGLPFPYQPERLNRARATLPELREILDLCIEIRLDRLSQVGYERGLEWLDGAGWIPDMVSGLCATLARQGLINLDLSDLRTIVARGESRSTLICATGDAADVDRLWRAALESPLDSLVPGECTTCLLHIEGGAWLTVAQLDAIADRFTDFLAEDATVILGARLDRELESEARIVGVIS